ncbi:hypothetical protein D3C78_1844050 [compost metagenome]
MILDQPLAIGRGTADPAGGQLLGQLLGGEAAGFAPLPVDQHIVIAGGIGPDQLQVLPALGHQPVAFA